MSQEVLLPTLRELRKDLREAASGAGVAEVRYLVDLYYELQHYRITASNQSGALAKLEEPSQAIQLLFSQFEGTENAIKAALEKWSDENPMGAWAKGHVGIGPVIAAGLASHIDVTRSETVGGVWRFAGLDPTMEWKKGQVRPYNAKLKVLSWKIGESFSRLRKHDKCWYGHQLDRAQGVRREEERGRRVRQAGQGDRRAQRVQQRHRGAENVRRREAAADHDRVAHPALDGEAVFGPLF